MLYVEPQSVECHIDTDDAEEAGYQLLESDLMNAVALKIAKHALNEAALP